MWQVQLGERAWKRLEWKFQAEKKRNGKARLPEKLNLHKEQGHLQYGRGTKWIRAKDCRCMLHTTLCRRAMEVRCGIPSVQNPIKTLYFVYPHTASHISSTGLFIPQPGWLIAWQSSISLIHSLSQSPNLQKASTLPPPHHPWMTSWFLLHWECWSYWKFPKCPTIPPTHPPIDS